MTNELTVIPRTIGMMGGMGMLKPEFIEDAVSYQKRNRRSIPILLRVTLQVLRLKNLKETVSYPVSVTTSLPSATRHSYTESRMLQEAILQVSTLEIPRSECPTKSWAECRVH